MNTSGLIQQGTTGVVNGAALPTVGSSAAEASFDTDAAMPPLGALMRRYVHGYTNCHDFGQCREIMTDDYTLYMGEHTVRGRDEAYIPATATQFRQFPGLGLTVHDFVTSGDRAAIVFSEHGRSVLSGNSAAWAGISLYRWNGRQLTECRVEQDYYARRIQSRSCAPDPIPTAAHDPWSSAPQAPDEHTEQIVRNWLHAGGIQGSAIGSLDNEATGFVRRPLIGKPTITVLDLFTSGQRAAFHMLIQGAYAGGLDDLDHRRHQPISLYVTGVANVTGRSVAVRAVSDRLAAERRMLLR